MLSPDPRPEPRLDPRPPVGRGKESEGKFVGRENDGMLKSPKLKDGSANCGIGRAWLSPAKTARTMGVWCLILRVKFGEWNE